MPPIEDNQPADLSPTIARLKPGGSLSDSMPDTFPSEAESLLKHLKLGAAGYGSSPPPGSPPAPSPASGQFPYIPDYEIECELGRGGMGVVYKARHVVLRHTVAIKMILTSAHVSPGEVTRFVAEAEAVATVKHSNVVHVFDLKVTPGPGPDAGRPYFVMEYVDGGNLAAHLKAVGGALPPDDAAELIETVARGVHAANDVGIVHRDLKPANILLGRDEGGGARDDTKTAPPSASGSSLALRPKVSDFGLAKRLSSDMTRSLAVMGTPAYMAPEQAGGKAKFVGPQADVYALGVILYQCLTGRVPFDNPDPWALIRQVLEDTPVPPRTRAPRVPRDLELICLKCLEKEAHHRYPTAAALADDLRRFLNREVVSVRPIGVPTRVARWAKKRPASAALALVGFLLVVSIPPLVVGLKARFDRKDEVNAAAQLTAVEARRAQAAAEQLAEARELFALQNKLRMRAAARPLGWTASTLGELPKATALARGDSAVLEDLRSIAATALMSDNLIPAEPVVQGMNAAALATDPKTGRVAVGEHKSWFDCHVLLIDPRTGQTVHTLAYPTVSLRGKTSWELVQDGTRALTFSPDGSRLFVGTRSGRVIRFDLGAAPAPPAKLAPAKIWQASSVSFGDLAVSADGKTVYTACRTDEPVLAWDADTGAKRKPLVPPPGEHVRGIAALPEGGVVAAGGGKLHQWNASGALVASTASEGANRVAVGPGSAFLVGNGARFEVYDRIVSGPIGESIDPTLRRAAHGESLKAIAVHPSRAFVATAAGDGERIARVWELASGRLLGAVVVPGTGPVRLAWSGDGEFLLATAHEHVARWRLVPAAARRFACGTALPAQAATFLPDGRVATITELYGFRRELLVGRVGESADLVPISEPGALGSAALSADSNGVVALTLATNGLWLWKPGQPLGKADFPKNRIRLPRFGADGRTLWAAFSSLEVRAIDPAKKTVLGKWDNAVGDTLTGLGSIEVLAAGRERAAVGTRDGSVYVLDAACVPLATFRKAGDPVLAVAVAPDDSLVAAGAQSGNVRLIRIADKVELPSLVAHPTGVSAVAIGPGGAMLATGGRDCAVRLWKRSGDSYQPLLTVSGLPDAVLDLQFHPTDGRLLVLLEHQHAVRVWDLAKLNAQLAEQKVGW